MFFGLQNVLVGVELISHWHFPVFWALMQEEAFHRFYFGGRAMSSSSSVFWKQSILTTEINSQGENNTI